MSTKYQKLLSLLKELFQTDQAELDFGMYKVINQRRDEINRFLEERLLPQIKEAFSTYQSMDTKILQDELKQAMRQAEDLGVDPETSSKVKGIREQIATYSVDVEDLENQVFSDLYNFFRRYYDEGDFISQRRYKEGVYAIPYEGEEVKLYWANYDQYYIKTSEYFRDYSFKLPSGKHAHFKLVEADTEKDNRKEIDNNKRRFVLAEEPLAWQDEEVVIRFEFRPDKANQSSCNKQTLEALFGLRKKLTEQVQKEALTELAYPATTEGNPDRTLLDKHLEDYTRRNTQDYFIHKDLGKFLRRELDFYIKNEIMHLDNIENESTPRVEEYLSKIKVIRQIAHKIIDFLAQIEDFQKKLWLKKKFVVETNYCITLDRVPEELYPEIAANDAQREEWVKMFAIDEMIKPSRNKYKGLYEGQAHTEPYSKEFLKTNPYLVLDTKFFDKDFKFRLLESFDNIDETLDGLLIHSENFQALNLLINQYGSKIKNIYIDPPYNTNASEIIYKNGYRDSSWISLMHDRLIYAKEFLKESGLIMTAIDDIEFRYLHLLKEKIFGIKNWVANISIMHNPRGRSDAKHFAPCHEYLIVYARDLSKLETNQLRQSEKKVAEKYPKEDNITKYRELPFRRSGSNSRRFERPNLYYEIFYNPEKDNLSLNDEEGFVKILPIDTSGNERVWRWGMSTFEKLKDTEFVVKKINNSYTIYAKDREKNKIMPKTVWAKSKYDASSHGTNLLKKLFNDSLFSYPKSIFAVEDAIQIASNKDSTILDFFAGSGTTGHAVINLNRKDQGTRKYILIEMGGYFDSVLIPRIKKVTYSNEWNNGKPTSRQGSSQMFKYMKLESYEDTLNNLSLKRTGTAQTTLLDETAFGEDYLLHYMLDFESRDSLLDLDRFKTPFDYQLQIASSTVGETEATQVDLVETFNYLLGLHVQNIRKMEGAVVVHGMTRDEKKVMVIWRTVPEMDNYQLNVFFEAHLAGESQEITDIYVNGDNNLANIRPDDQYWSVHLTEESFHRLMFEE